MAQKQNPRKKTSLGRGLSALLDDSAVSKSATKRTKTVAHPESLSDVAVSQIEVNPFQPRTEFDQEALSELAGSIKLHGIIQPLTLRKTGDDK